MYIEVTNKVNFGRNDDECLPLTKCVCGKEFEKWSQLLGIYEENAWECPACKRKLFFSASITVYQLEE